MPKKSREWCQWSGEKKSIYSFSECFDWKWFVTVIFRFNTMVLTMWAGRLIQEFQLIKMVWIQLNQQGFPMGCPSKVTLARKMSFFGTFKCHGIIQSNKAEFQGLSFQKTAERHEEIKALRALFPHLWLTIIVRLNIRRGSWLGGWHDSPSPFPGVFVVLFWFGFFYSTLRAFSFLPVIFP